MKNKYKELYIKFIYSEIPNFIQILGVLSLFNFLLNNKYLSLVSIFIISLLFEKYLIVKYLDFIKVQIFDSHSEFNTEEIDVNTIVSHQKKYILVTQLIFYIVLIFVLTGIYLQ